MVSLRNLNWVIWTCLLERYTSPTLRKKTDPIFTNCTSALGQGWGPDPRPHPPSVATENVLQSRYTFFVHWEIEVDEYDSR